MTHAISHMLKECCEERLMGKSVMFFPTNTTAILWLQDQHMIKSNESQVSHESPVYST